MALIRALDEALVAMSVGLWLDLQATPSAWLIAFGVLAVGAAVVVAVRHRTVMIRMVLAPCSGPGAVRRVREDHVEPPQRSPIRVGRARGPRAPGQVVLRPTPTH